MNESVRTAVVVSPIGTYLLAQQRRPGLIGLDIETDTSGGGGLDPTSAGVTAVAVSTVVGMGQEASLSTTVFSGGGERSLLQKVEAHVRELPAGIIVTWNGSCFDLPFLADRMRLHGVDTALRLSPDPMVVVKYAPLPGHQGGYRARWGAHQHVDVAGLYRAFALEHGLAWSLKPVARAVLGVKPIEVDRSAVHQLSDEALVRYNASDAVVTLALGARIDAMTNADRI